MRSPVMTRQRAGLICATGRAPAAPMGAQCLLAPASRVEAASPEAYRASERAWANRLLQPEWNRSLGRRRPPAWHTTTHHRDPASPRAQEQHPVSST